MPRAVVFFAVALACAAPQISAGADAAGAGAVVKEAAGGDTRYAAFFARAALAPDVRANVEAHLARRPRLVPDPVRGITPAIQADAFLAETAWGRELREMLGEAGFGLFVQAEVERFADGTEGIIVRSLAREGQTLTADQTTRLRQALIAGHQPPKGEEFPVRIRITDTTVKLASAFLTPAQLAPLRALQAVEAQAAAGAR